MNTSTSDMDDDRDDDDAGAEGDTFALGESTVTPPPVLRYTPVKGSKVLAHYRCDGVEYFAELNLARPKDREAYAKAAAAVGVALDPPVAVDQGDVANQLMAEAVAMVAGARIGGGVAGGGEDGDEDDEKAQEADDSPRRLARLFLDEFCTHPDGPTVVHHRGEFHRWQDGSYRPYPGIQADVVVAVEAEFDRLGREAVTRARAAAAARGRAVDAAELPRVRKVGKRLIADVMMSIEAAVTLDTEVDAPCWLDRDLAVRAARPPVAEVLVASNGLVDLRDLSIIPHTPLFFTPYVLTYAFDREAPEAGALKGYMDSVWGTDTETRREIQKWFGYQLTPDTSQHKGALLLGPRRSGRGTLVRLLSRMLGEHQIANPSMASLTTPFGLACLLGKLAAIVGDARVGGDVGDRKDLVALILGLIGEDSVQVARKYKDDVRAKLGIRFTVLTNELPNVRDESGAFPARFLVIKFPVSFAGREDRGLEGRLLAELPSILNWAITGRAMLREDGGFLQPEAALDEVETFRLLTSPTAAFFAECCDPLPADAREGADLPTTQDIYRGWCEWAVLRGHARGNAGVFVRNLKAAIPGISNSRPRVAGADGAGQDRRPRLCGLALNDEGRRMLRDWAARERARTAPSGGGMMNDR
jgi:putative DNA primase/helicase